MKLKDIKGLKEKLISIICVYKKKSALGECKNHEECKDIAEGISYELELVVDVEKVFNIVGIIRLGITQGKTDREIAQAIAKADIFKVKEEQ